MPFASEIPHSTIAGFVFVLQNKARDMLDLRIALDGAPLAELARALARLEGVRVTDRPEDAGHARCYLVHCLGFQMILSRPGGEGGDSAVAVVAGGAGGGIRSRQPARPFDERAAVATRRGGAGSAAQFLAQRCELIVEAPSIDSPARSAARAQDGAAPQNANGARAVQATLRSRLCSDTSESKHTLMAS
jgi:hypothetical protein